MNNIGIQITRRIYVTQQYGKGFRGTELFSAYIGGTKTIATGLRAAQVKSVRYLEVIAETFVQHDFGTFKSHGLYIYKRFT